MSELLDLTWKLIQVVIVSSVGVPTISGLCSMTLTLEYQVCFIPLSLLDGFVLIVKLPLLSNRVRSSSLVLQDDSQRVQEGVEAGADEQRQHGTQRHHVVEFGLQYAPISAWCLRLIGRWVVQ